VEAVLVVVFDALLTDNTLPSKLHVDLVTFTTVWCNTASFRCEGLV
jgi:hypothetical protein